MSLTTSSTPALSASSALDANASLTDPRATKTWFYEGSRLSTLRLEVEKVWTDYTGKGVKVGVLDSKVDFTHDDLTPNYDSSNDFDFVTGSADVTIDPKVLPNNHGTFVAGVIAAAAHNGIGSAGVAHGASISSLALDYSTEGAVAQALAGLRHASTLDIVNCSWSFTRAFEDDFYRKSDYAAALAQPVLTGRDGLGTVVVFAAGNSALETPSNTHNFQNSPYAIAVGAIDPSGAASAFSSVGFNVLVSAPGRGVLSTGLRDSYAEVTGTSFAAPVVSGVVALMLDANEDLGYRDVQQILALSASRVGLRETPSHGTGWQENGAVTLNGGGMTYSDVYGFGMVNAFDAVRLAETWTEQQTAANRTSLTVKEAVTGQDLLAGKQDHSVIKVAVDQDIEVEHVQLAMDLRWMGSADLEVFLTSPDGTRSQLMYDILSEGSIGSVRHFAFTTVASMGENGKGVWTVDIINKNPDLVDKTGAAMAGILESVTLTVHGDTTGIENDTYFYSDAFGRGEGSAVLSDADKRGVDTLNAAMVDGVVSVALGGQWTSSIAGRVISITSGDIENVYGGIGNDLLAGDADNNYLNGGRGADRFHASLGQDSLVGGAGQDVLVTDANLAQIVGQVLGTDTLVMRLAGGLSNVTTVTGIESFQFKDQTVTFADLFSLFGGTGGGDTGGGTDTGGGGDTGGGTDPGDGTDPGGDTGTGGDLIPPTPAATVQGTAGDDLMAGTSISEVIYLQSGNDSVSARAGDDVLHGGAGNDRLSGDMGADWIYGGEGNDTLLGDGGDDVLFGGEGLDIFAGGLGADTFVINVGARDAVDVVRDFDSVEGDIIRLEGFGPGLSTEDIHLTQAGRSMNVILGEGASAVTLFSIRGTGLDGLQLQSTGGDVFLTV